MTLNIIFFSVTLVIMAVALLCELKRDLMMMQQNSYRIDRYMRWLRDSADTTSLERLVGMCVFLGSLVTFTRPLWGCCLIGVFGAGLALWLISRRYKKPLVWTPRCRRIYSVAVALVVIVSGAVVALSWREGIEQMLFAVAVTLAGVYCVSHVVLIAAVWLLGPVEKHINAGYYDDAARILRSMPELKVVGITGSYGKTSTKHYLHRILSESYEVLMTPGSYNTTMGVIRTVRELMKPYTEVFICEMGAKQPGDIKEICDLVHPQIGIVTAVGPQHLESFKTIERVRDTKFELVDSLPSDGLAVVNDDFEAAAGRQVDNVECVRYAVTSAGAAAFTAEDIVYGIDGTDFIVVCPDGARLPLHTRLVGECNISNLLAAVIVALRLGVPETKISQAVARIEQVEHRLSIKHTAGGVTIIDDAFNSNPTGSAMALDVLRDMPGRRIVVTPGMIELGDRQDELNRAFGAKIAASCDIAVVVSLVNRESITAGIDEGHPGVPGPEVYTVDTFADAQQLLAPMLRKDDFVLYENDLPDTFK